MNVFYRIRKPVLLSYLRCLVEPLVETQENFIGGIDEIVYFLSHTGQVIYLEKAINEKFLVPGYDPMQHILTRRILVTDGNQLFPSYLFLDQEEKPIYLGEEFIFTESELVEDYFDFFVVFPSGYQPYDYSILKALVNKYKLPGKNWDVKFI